MSPDLDGAACIDLDRDSRHLLHQDSDESNHDVSDSTLHHPHHVASPDDFYSSQQRALKLETHMASSSPAYHSSLIPLAANMKSPADGGPRAAARSASNPLDGKSSGPTLTKAPTGKPSVKDLKKRFDQNGSASPSLPRAPLRPGAPPPIRTTRPLAANGTPKLRAGSLLDSTTTTPFASDSPSAARVQRQKSIALTSSSQSFASRIGRPRNSINGKPTTSKSMTQLQHRTLPGQPPSPPAVTSRSTALLFGEIGPDHCGASIAGFGVQHSRPRKASDSNVPAPRRRFSGPDSDSSSPSSCYRQVDALQGASLVPPGVRSRFHARSRSDASAPLTCVGFSCKPLPRTPSTAGLGHSSSASRLPVSVRLLTSPVESTSPASTRSNSPTALKCSLANGRISAIGAIATPSTAHASTRTRTPTQVRKPSPHALVTPDSLARIHSAAPPTKSLPLRSSRPRLPVSVAGSRKQEMDAQPSRLGPFPNGPSRTNEETARRRKISIGPIDFEQRREHIRLAYSKSIRESEALEARQIAAAEKKRRDLEAAAAAKAKSRVDADVAPRALSEVPDAYKEKTSERRSRQTAAQPAEFFEAQLSADAAAQPLPQTLADSLTRPPLAVCTTLEPDHVVATPQPADEVDSPTLGVPGSFPVFSSPSETGNLPLSAVSGVSDTTEFDVDPQTNPPIQGQSPLNIHITIAEPSSPQHATSTQAQAAYQYPFDEESDTSEQVSQNARALQDAERPDEAQDATFQPEANDGVESKPVSLEKTLSAHQTLGAVVSVLPATEEETEEVESSATIPFPRLELLHDEHDLSDCESDLEVASRGDCYARQGDDDVTDACTEETDEHEDARLGQTNFGPDEPPSERASTCTSSDAGAVDNGEDSVVQSQPRDTANPSGLVVPPRLLQDDRLSQQSTWTDFSIDSTDPSDPTKSLAMHSRPDSPSFGHVTIFESNTRGRDSRTSLADTNHTPSTRGLDDSKTSSSSSSSAHATRSRLPEVDTGDGFFVPNLSSVASVSLSFLPPPEHEPSPIPNSVSGSALDSRTSSIFYDQSYYGSTVVSSEKEIDECASPLQTPQSLDMALPTTEAPDVRFSNGSMTDGDTKPAVQESDSKERHRLVQRRNVIKELIDTEAVFVRDMNIVEEIYKGTAEACPELDSKTVKLIFRNSDEIIHFHTQFLRELKAAVASVYVPVGGRGSLARGDSQASERGHGDNPQDSRDRATCLGPVFQSNVESMRLAHEGFLRNSDHAAKRLIQIQQDATVKVWLNECNEVAKDLTAAWDLDSLLIKPMQRITKYPNLIVTLLQHTPSDHPDREALLAAKDSLETAIIEINRTKKNFELVGQIVGRKRKESDVKAGFARAFGKRVDKLQASTNRPREDQEYVKLNEKFGDDYLRLQVVLRDVEYYTRQVAAYVHEFLQYLSSIELVMRFQPGNYPELESKWVQFNISVRDLEKVALEEHLAQVRKHVIEPFELVIKAYGNPSLAMKKRQKRRLDYERMEQLKRSGKTADPKLRELVEQYEALNDTLKKELPVLSALTEKVGNICLRNFVNIQANWYVIWKEKMKTVVGDCGEMPDLKEVVSTFQRDHPFVRDQLSGIGMLNPASRGRLSHSASANLEDSAVRARGRVLSINGDAAPMLPPPDFGERRSGSLTMSPSAGSPGLGGGMPHQYYYKDYYSGIHTQQASPRSPDMVSSSRTGATSTRPSTSRSIDSTGLPPRRSLEVLWLAASLFEFNISTTKHEAGYPYLTYQAGEIFDVVAEKGELWLAKNQDDATNRSNNNLTNDKKDCTPYLLKLGLSKSNTSLIWIAGPLSGLVVQPIIGVVADENSSRWGRRRPLMVVGAVVVATGLLVLGFTREIVAWASGGLGLTIGLAVVTIYVVDFALNVVQSCARSLVVDTLPLEQQQTGAAWWSRMAAIGHVIGYAAGSVDLVSLLGTALGDAQFQQLTVMAAWAMLASTALTCWAVTEPVLVLPAGARRKSIADVLHQVFRTLRRLSPRIQAICWAQFWAWIGWFPFLFYSTTWVGETYFRYDAPAEETQADDGDRVGDMGRIGSISLFIYSFITFVGAFVLPILIRSPEDDRFTPRPSPAVARLLGAVGDRRPDLVTAWMCGHVVFAASMVFAPLATSFRFATVLMCLCALPWTMATWAPPALLGVEVNKMSGSAYRPLPDDMELRNVSGARDYDNHDDGGDDNGRLETAPAAAGGKSSTAELSGIYLGILNVYTTMPQFVGAFIASIVFAVLEPGGSSSSSKPNVEDGSGRRRGPSAISVCLFIGACSAVVAAFATRKLKLL
ncbi:hypothetical protein L249_3448 [Ophiocordyceps polyrhachis-furcata BCC 54312]|uniref:DH domain-containing protein n=1 Tax=Ophiocordyceps polyrhachis-furcata BCC 54312 TaxID=1330021 RepID=A0A367LML9_9HYPO|nr:hypothetical protein L249_3448 [Ophiocordyceps polyrhachis-furcata BCC 54312]